MKRFVDQLSIEHLWPLTVMIGIFAFANTQPVMPHDYWWHMAIGRDILASGSIPTVDVYSYTRVGEVYASYQQFWLMEVLLYLLYQAGGVILTLLVQSALVVVTYGLLLWLSWQQTRNWRAAALGLLFAAAMGFGNWNIRPQTVTFLLAALFLTAIDRLRHSGSQRRWMWLGIFPLLMIFWVNSHGSFPIGFALLGVWWLEDAVTAFQSRNVRLGQSWLGWLSGALWMPTLAILLAGLGCLFNPRGLGFVSYLSGMAANPIVQNYITEWMPPSFDTIDGAVFLSGLLLFSTLLAVSPRRPRLGQILLFLIFGFLALHYIRGVVWFGLVLAPVAADHLAAVLERAGVAATPPPPSAASRRLNWLVAGMLLVLGVFSLPWFKQFLPLTPEKRGLLAGGTPVQATQILLEQQLPPNLFHGMAYGSYLVWAAQPDYKVFVDSRIELYPPEIWGDYVRIGSGEGDWQTLLEKYQVNSLMLEPKNQAGLIEAVRAAGDWREVYADDFVVLFTRR